METTGSSQLRTITQNLPQEYHLHCGLERPPLGSFRVWEPGPSQPHIVGGDRRGWRWGWTGPRAEQFTPGEPGGADWSWGSDPGLPLRTCSRSRAEQEMETGPRTGGAHL